MQTAVETQSCKSVAHSRREIRESMEVFYRASAQQPLTRNQLRRFVVFSQRWVAFF